MRRRTSRCTPSGRQQHPARPRHRPRTSASPGRPGLMHLLSTSKNEKPRRKATWAVRNKGFHQTPWVTGRATERQGDASDLEKPLQNLIKAKLGGRMAERLPLEQLAGVRARLRTKQLSISRGRRVPRHCTGLRHPARALGLVWRGPMNSCPSPRDVGAGPSQAQRGEGLGGASIAALRSHDYFAFTRPYLAVKLALPRELALIMKPASAAVASAGSSSLSVFKACTVKT